MPGRLLASRMTYDEGGGGALPCTQMGGGCPTLHTNGGSALPCTQMGGVPYLAHKWGGGTASSQLLEPGILWFCAFGRGVTLQWPWPTMCPMLPPDMRQRQPKHSTAHVLATALLRPCGLPQRTTCAVWGRRMVAKGGKGTKGQVCPLQWAPIAPLPLWSALPHAPIRLAFPMFHELVQRSVRFSG